jgi:hypothetical protein
MRNQILFAVAMVSAANGASAGEQYGQYACVVDRSVGIIHHDSQSDYAGLIALPGNRSQFSMTLQPIKQDEQTINLCKESIDYYLNILQHREPYSTNTPFSRGIGPRTVLGNRCFTRDEIVVKYPIENKDKILRGYNDGLDRSHFSDVEGNWLDFSDARRFSAVVQYDNGPVLEEGHCDKLAAAQ